jgi:hypothetical protein
MENGNLKIQACKGALSLALICGLGAYLGYLFGTLEKTPGYWAVAWICGSLALFFVLLAVVFALWNPNAAGGRGGRRASASGLCRDPRLREMAQAAQALFDFLKEVGRSARCQEILRKLPNMEKFDAGKGNFTITPRLGAIAYCDVRDCFRRLGYSPASLNRVEGYGYAMFMSLLIVPDFDMNRYFDPRQSRELVKIIAELDHTATVEVDIYGYENESRFSVVFGKAYGEDEWVQRYSTLLYRWASLIAKADGEVTAKESAALSAIMNMKEPPKPEGNVRVSNGKSLEEALHELDALVGLAPVKADVRKLASFIEIQRKREESGLKNASVSYHCVFTGNPGTGKTTVARILADIYHAMGVLKKGHLVETDRSGLVGEYVGQTAVKTNKIIDSALDGVLFVDEAYSLVQGGEKDFGGEAISTLLKRMEDDRGRLIVILAGYTNEMKKFIDSNPGLQSRFSRYIEFPDYSADELAQIFLRNVEKNQYVCDADVRNSIRDVMRLAVAKKDRNFGNARYVRNLFENAIQRQAVRLSTVAPLTTQMLSEITLHDLGFEYE